MSITMTGPFSSGACVGVDGASTVTTTSAVRVTGLIHAIYLSYVGDDPATTDVTIRTLGTSPAAPSYNILVRADSATDALLLPRFDTHKNTDAAALTTFTGLMPVDDYLQIVVAQGNTNDIVYYWLFLER